MANAVTSGGVTVVSALAATVLAVGQFSEPTPSPEPLSASAVAAGLRSGELDLARDLLPQDLEAVLREPRFRSGLSESPKKNTYFLLFHSAGQGPEASAAGANPELRRALAGMVRTQDLVWTALGRFAMPATGLLPPGILGHDPGRRRTPMSREEAQALLTSSGAVLPMRLRASVHPSLTDRYRSLLAALQNAWRELGVEVDLVGGTMAEYLATWDAPAGIDLLIGRWNADYGDPDNFTYSLFHGRSGLLRAFYSTPEFDRLAEEARTEVRPAAREALYRRLESLLLDSAALVPLFHEIDDRIAGPSVRGLNLRSIPPYVSYADIARVAVTAPAPGPAGSQGGLELSIPIEAADR
jgi:ABC-type transport system substrate-binding protein